MSTVTGKQIEQALEQMRHSIETIEAMCEQVRVMIARLDADSPTAQGNPTRGPRRKPGRR